MVSCMKDWPLKWQTSAEGVHCLLPFWANMMHRLVCRADGQLMTSVFVEGFDSTRPVQRDWTMPGYWDWFWAAKRMFAAFVVVVFLRYSVPRVFLQWYEVCVSFLRQVYIIAASQPDFERCFRQSDTMLCFSQWATSNGGNKKVLHTFWGLDYISVDLWRGHQRWLDWQKSS